jgi:hypothetical protein
MVPLHGQGLSLCFFHAPQKAPSLRFRASPPSRFSGGVRPSAPRPGSSGPVGRGLRGGSVPLRVPRLALSRTVSRERKTGFEPATLTLAR